MVMSSIKLMMEFVGDNNIFYFYLNFLQTKNDSIQKNSSSTPDVLCFKNLGSQGWLPGAPWMD